MNLVVLQLNIRSILSHVTELKRMLHTLETKNSQVNIILLCETFLSKTTEKLVKIPGYTLICNSRIESKDGGTAILLQNGINYKRRKDIEVFQEKCVESTIIEIIAKDGIRIIVGSMYRSPNTDPIDFRNTINMISSNSLEEKKEIILGMDYNIDLLKSGIHRQTQFFVNDLLEKNIYPTITRHT